MPSFSISAQRLSQSRDPPASVVVVVVVVVVVEVVAVIVDVVVDGVVVIDVGPLLGVSVENSVWQQSAS